MALRGYKPKTKPAIWQQAFPEQRELPPDLRWMRKPKVGVAEAEAVLKNYVVGGRSKKLFPRIRSVSKRNRGGKSAYRREARAYVRAARAAGDRCPVVAAVPELRDGNKYGWPISDELNEVHHTRGRVGPLLRDQRFWLAVSKQGHRWIHEHPEEARSRGWLARRGDWNRAAPDEAKGAICGG